MTGQPQTWMVRAPGDVERIEARLSGTAFAPHRHDTYAIGITLKGVQSFDYRGEARHSLPGQLVILHPDELHDGRAGDDDAFQYRTAYIAPADVQAVLGGRALPFVEGGVSSAPRLQSAVCSLLSDYERPLAELEFQDALFQLATALEQVSGATRASRIANREATLLARDYIEARLVQGFSLEELERAVGHDRWQLSRDFRAEFVTSPYRYLMWRRLDKARRLMADGNPVAEAASACGFSDQSNLIRQFKGAYGLTPRVWAQAMSPAHDHSITPPGARPT